MTRYLLQRFLQALVVVLLVTLITFTILHLLPGGAARAALGKEATQAQIDAFNAANGFDQPLPLQYLSYLGRLFTGDLGYSTQMNQEVSQAIAQRMPKTMVLSLMSICIAVTFAVPLGVFQAVKRNKAADYIGTVFALLAYSTPLFFLGLVFIIIFSQKLAILPPEAPQGYTLGEVLSDFKALILPAVTLAVVTMAAYSRYVRSSMIDNLNENYIRTARAKGLSESRIIFGHALRNSLFPIITLLGMYLPALFSGALVVESLFNYPGMGLMFWQAAQHRDYPVLLAVTVIVSLATVLGNLLADICYAIADPRVRSGGKN
ncbi:ABC-type dipeptide/oligopeptide/nickel transport system, permease component [Corynebacterium mustelae]|uniref:ABC-type dipeptide/oligopeptide/nickel transport system, permease component n=1 Tax=Corynebacterium mustelae TaxID=571915 RepID=A0A0G3H034_9CORY|nr:ABC transporter permease [Corynebacterium mustelae]AKK05168.1 ABC-type dipeptide/oligopeptide/nickel transport system, permease component [Corynebacterium mustelae]